MLESCLLTFPMRMIFVSQPVEMPSSASARDSECSKKKTNLHVDLYLYIFLAHVRYSAVYCNSFQSGSAEDVFPEKDGSLL